MGQAARRRQPIRASKNVVTSGLARRVGGGRVDGFDRRDRARLTTGEHGIAPVVAQPGIGRGKGNGFGVDERVAPLGQPNEVPPSGCVGAELQRIVVTRLPLENRADRNTVALGPIEPRRQYGAARDDAARRGDYQRCRGESKSRGCPRAHWHALMLARACGSVDHAVLSSATSQGRRADRVCMAGLRSRCRCRRDGVARLLASDTCGHGPRCGGRVAAFRLCGRGPGS